MWTTFKLALSFSPSLSLALPLPRSLSPSLSRTHTLALSHTHTHTHTHTHSPEQWARNTSPPQGEPPSLPHRSFLIAPSREEDAGSEGCWLDCHPDGFTSQEASWWLSAGLPLGEQRADETMCGGRSDDECFLCNRLRRIKKKKIEVFVVIVKYI